MARIRLSNGRLVEPLDLQEEDVVPAVVIHSLSMLPRFCGQSAWPFTVGQHTLNLVNYVPTRLRRVAMLHDWSETFGFNDVASPVKIECPDYKRAEHACGMRILNMFRIPSYLAQDLDEYDKRMYKNEREALFPAVSELGMGDQYIKLEDPCAVLKFKEQHWERTESKLLDAFCRLWPDWRPTMSVAEYFHNHE